MAYETEKLNISIPAPVREIFDVFSSAGAVAYAVGGAVRDSLLGREVHDWDVASPFRPDRTSTSRNSRAVTSFIMLAGTPMLMAAWMQVL